MTYFEDLEPGESLLDLHRGPLTSMHLMRWSAAIENWHRIHYDAPFAVEHDGLPSLLINGSWKQHLLVQAARTWAGDGGWLRSLTLQFRAMDRVGDTLTMWGSVESKTKLDGLGAVYCDVGIRNQDGVESTQGKAEILLPYRDGPPVPYPVVDLHVPVT